MKYSILFPIYFTISILLISACYFDNEEDLYGVSPESNSENEPGNDSEDPPFNACDTSAISFSTDIIILLNEHCIECHNDEFELGEVNLEGYNRVKIFVNDGSLLGSINHDPGFDAMPPGEAKIPPCSIDKIRSWIEAGALEN